MERQTVTSGDLRIKVHVWPATGASRGDVLLVHGLAEHMGRYEHVAAALVGGGWRVVGVELRGHGHSDGERGHVDAWSDYLQDLCAVESLLEERYVVLGHSMGGLVVLDHMRESTRARAAIITGALIGIAIPVPGWKRLLASALSSVLPRLSIPTGLDPTHISHDAEVVKAYVDDPLVFSTATARWLTEMESAAARVAEHAPRYTQPMWMAWGTEDHIVSVSALERFAQAAPTAEAHPQEGLFHEVLNEPAKHRLLGEIVSWLDEL